MRQEVSPTLLVLAAGLGSRYGGLKQVEAVGPGGETIIDYSVYDALCAGFRKLVFVVRREMERAFRQMIGARFEERIAVEYVFQELDGIPAGYSVPMGRTKPWGTAHAILSASAAIDEPFAAINADDFYGAAAFRVLAEHLRMGTGDYAMVGFVLRNTLSEFGAVARGVCRVSGDGYLEDVVELTKIERDGEGVHNTNAAGQVSRLTGDEIVSMNMWGFTPRIFGELEDGFKEFLARRGSDARAEYYIPSVVNDLVAARRARIKVLRTDDAWFGVTYREDQTRVVESVGRLIRDGNYPERLWA